MKKIIQDTLQSNGKWSRKSLTILTTFVFILALGTFIVISDKILEKEVNRYAINVFDSLLVFESLLMGLSEASKKFVNKQEPVNQE
jgi:hypothetical protein